MLRMMLEFLWEMVSRVLLEREHIVDVTTGE